MLFEKDISEFMGKPAFIEIECLVERDGNEYDDPCMALPLNGVMVFPAKDPQDEIVTTLDTKELEYWANEFQDEMDEKAFEWKMEGN